MDKLHWKGGEPACLKSFMNVSSAELFRLKADGKNWKADSDVQYVHVQK
jgi:hypothetical protein